MFDRPRERIQEAIEQYADVATRLNRPLIEAGNRLFELASLLAVVHGATASDNGELAVGMGGLLAQAMLARLSLIKDAYQKYQSNS